MSQPKKASYVLSEHIGIEQPYHWVFKNPDGDIIFISENYKAKQGALAGIASVRKNCQDNAQYQKLTASDGKLYFTLEAKNGEIIGRSQFYTSQEKRDTAIQELKDYGVDAILVDTTESSKGVAGGAVTTDLAKKDTSAGRYA